MHQVLSRPKIKPRRCSN